MNLNLSGNVFAMQRCNKKKSKFDIFLGYIKNAANNAVNRFVVRKIVLGEFYLCDIMVPSSWFFIAASERTLDAGAASVTIL